MTLDATQQALIDGARARLREYNKNMEVSVLDVLLTDDMPDLLALVTDLAAQVDTFTAEVERLRGHLAAANYQYDERVQEVSDEMTRREAAEAENATLRAQVEAVRAASALLRANTEAVKGVRAEHWRGSDYADGVDRATEDAADLIDDALDAASPTPHTPTKEHQ